MASKKGVEKLAVVGVIFLLGIIFFALAFNYYKSASVSIVKSVNVYVLSKANIEPIKNLLFKTLKTLKPVEPEITYKPTHFCMDKLVTLSAGNSKYGGKNLSEVVSEVCPEYGACTYWKICKLSANQCVDPISLSSQSISINYNFSKNFTSSGNYNIELTVRTAEGKNYTTSKILNVSNSSKCKDIDFELSGDNTSANLPQTLTAKAVNLWIEADVSELNVSLYHYFALGGDQYWNLVQSNVVSLFEQPIEFYDVKNISWIGFFNASNQSQSIAIKNITGYYVND
ncbi:MAG: hypothetical protein ACP5JY_01075 [Candidatus Nanoarchaeia archaeon]